jgi:hypothetical protein
MMDQYQHSQTYTTFPSHHYAVFPTPSTNYNLLEENYVYTSLPQPSYYDPYEQYSIDNSTTAETIYHPIQSYQDFSLANTQPQIIEQSFIDQKPIVNEAKYKWMEIKRAPPKTSGIQLIISVLVRK